MTTNIFNIILQPWEVADAPAGTKKEKKKKGKKITPESNQL